MSFLSETAYLKLADNLVPVPIVCQLAQNRDYTHLPRRDLSEMASLEKNRNSLQTGLA
jgi:hypothetical protein